MKCHNVPLGLLALLLITLLLSGCGILFPTPTPTYTPTPTHAPTPTLTNTPTATPIPTDTPVPPTDTATPVPKPQITASVGVLVISSVQSGDRFPPGCSLDSLGCQKAQAGYQVLMVWLERADGGDPADIGGDLFDTSEGTYVIASDGSRTNRFGGGMTASRLFVGFTPPASARGFQLVWPDNPAIDLGK